MGRGRDDPHSLLPVEVRGVVETVLGECKINEWSFIRMCAIVANFDQATCRAIDRDGTGRLSLQHDNKSVIFDLDGTLADTGHDLINAANQCFIDLGVGEMLCPVEDKLTAFKGGRAMIRLGFQRMDADPTHEEIDEQYILLLQNYENAIDTFTYLYDGVHEILVELTQKEWSLGVCTNKPERLARILLDKLGILGHFRSLVGADTYPFRKPDPRALTKTIEAMGGTISRSVLIGDTVTDLETARGAGIPIVLVGFGPMGKRIAEIRPDRILTSYHGLPEIANSLVTDQFVT